MVDAYCLLCFNGGVGEEVVAECVVVLDLDRPAAMRQMLMQPLKAAELAFAFRGSPRQIAGDFPRAAIGAGRQRRDFFIGEVRLLVYDVVGIVEVAPSGNEGDEPRRERRYFEVFHDAAFLLSGCFQYLRMLVYAIGYNPHKYNAPYVVYSVYVKDCKYCYYRPTEYMREVDARIAYYNCLMDDWACRQCSLTKMG